MGDMMAHADPLLLLNAIILVQERWPDPGSDRIASSPSKRAALVAAVAEEWRRIGQFKCQDDDFFPYSEGFVLRTWTDFRKKYRWIKEEWTRVAIQDHGRAAS